MRSGHGSQNLAGALPDALGAIQSVLQVAALVYIWVRFARGPADDRERLVKATLEELANPLTPVLATGAGVSAASGAVADAGLIATVLGGNAVLGGLQRLSADRAVRRLEGSNGSRVRTRRAGAEAPVSGDALVVGDVVVLQAGDLVPADCRVLEASSLEADESSLTGESLPVAKTASPTPALALTERGSMLYAGSTVAAGSGVAVVVATGDATEAGRSLEAVAGAPPAGGVEARLRGLTRLSLPLALGSGAAVVGAGVLRGRPLRASLGTAVGLALASVPEGLPVVATAAQLAAARRLTRHNAIVRNLRTVEALGRVDVLCFDKTGTLTEGRIRLAGVSDGVALEPAGELAAPRRAVLAAALRATPDGDGERLAHATDRAVLDGAAAAGVAAAEGADGWRPLTELPFEPSRGFHAVVGQAGGGRRLVVKGAPELVLPRCERWRTPDGPRALDDAARRRLEQEVERLAGMGQRVLAVAERPASRRTALDERRIGRLELLGLVGLADPVRPTAAAAVAGLRRAGVEVVIVTGDHPSTARAIGAELGAADGRGLLTGPELDGMDDRELDRAVRDVRVFARVSPAHKVRVVRALRRAGRVVAVTGDGANDAPAIRLAHVGIALGGRGTAAARDAADLVIADDRVETLVEAIIEGRALWSSVRDAIAVLLGGNLGEIGFTVAGSALSGGSPINARQLLVVNLLTDVLPSMALAVRPPRHASPEALLREGPDASLGAALRRDVAVRAVATGTGAAAAWWVARRTGGEARARTVALVALVGAQLGQTVAIAPTDPVVLAASLASAGTLAAAVQVPGVSHLLGSRPLGPVGWTIGLGGAALGTGTALLLPRLPPFREKD
jgi:cation-transporting ATPase I